MPRVATTADVFNAIAEPRRRQIVDLLDRGGSQPVNRLVELLRLPQPAVSKHLCVLREVGLVSVSKQGRQRVYQLNGDRLKAVHDWVSTFEKYWSHQLDRVKRRAEQIAAQRASKSIKPNAKP